MVGLSPIRGFKVNTSTLKVTFGDYASIIRHCRQTMQGQDSGSGIYVFCTFSRSQGWERALCMVHLWVTLCDRSPRRSSLAADD